MILTEEQINALPLSEQKSYRTMQMLKGFLSNNTKPRTTVSPGEVLTVNSRVAPFMSLDYKKETTMVIYEEDK